MYELRYSEKALKQLKKLDKSVASLIVGWLSKNINHSENPRSHGKALTENHKGKWRYRVGDYRILCLIKDTELVVIALTIGHRRDIYL